jgi:hypothetical protein
MIGVTGEEQGYDLPSIPLQLQGLAGLGGGPIELVAATASLLPVVTGIDVNIGAGHEGAAFAVSDNLTGAVLFQGAVNGILAEGFTWRGAYCVPFGDGLDFSAAGGDFDVFVSGYWTLIPVP